MDEDANVIWGARVDEEMKGKIMVMTIITGVRSPWLLGSQGKKTSTAQRASSVNRELGISTIY